MIRKALRALVNFVSPPAPDRPRDRGCSLREGLEQQGRAPGWQGVKDAPVPPWAKKQRPASRPAGSPRSSGSSPYDSGSFAGGYASGAYSGGDSGGYSSGGGCDTGGGSYSGGGDSGCSAF